MGLTESAATGSDGTDTGSQCGSDGTDSVGVMGLTVWE